MCVCVTYDLLCFATSVKLICLDIFVGLKGDLQLNIYVCMCI